MLNPGRIASLFFVMVFFTLSAMSEETDLSPQQAFNRQFESSRITFLEDGSPYLEGPAGTYNPVLRFLFEKVMGWVPTGKASALTGPCQPELLSARLQDPRIHKSAALQGAVVQKYLQECKDEFQSGPTSTLANAKGMMTMKFEPTKHPFLSPVLFHLPGNIKLKGLLALKGDYKKRPLIVIRVGVFSNVAEFFPERAWIMMLFEQTPFNVLLVENMTGADFISNNSQFSFGGYDEGIQNILIAQMLQDPNEPLSKLISSMHLFGVSLGGHGVLFASLLNELNSAKAKPLYRSFLGVCPVVDLNASMEGLTKDKPFAYTVDYWSRRRLAGLRNKLPALEDHTSFAFLETAVSEVVRTYQGGLSYVSTVRLPEGMQDSSDFWKLNDFWPYYENVRKPVLILSTHHDPIVPFAKNSELIQNHTLKLNHANINVVDFAEGVHCTLPIAYDWKVLSTMFQSYFLSHAEEFSLETQELRLELDEETSQESTAQEFDPKAKIDFDILPMKAVDRFVQLAVHLPKVEGGSHEESGDKPREKFSGKSQTLKMNLPLSQFDFRFFNSTLSASEQWMIQRWLNQNISLKLESSEGRWFLVATWPQAK